jgi:flagellar hook-length control protein FliK
VFLGWQFQNGTRLATVRVGSVEGADMDFGNLDFLNNVSTVTQQETGTAVSSEQPQEDFLEKFLAMLFDESQSATGSDQSVEITEEIESRVTPATGSSEKGYQETASHLFDRVKSEHFALESPPVVLAESSKVKDELQPGQIEGSETEGPDFHHELTVKTAAEKAVGSSQLQPEVPAETAEATQPNQAPLHFETLAEHAAVPPQGSPAQPGESAKPPQPEEPHLPRGTSQPETPQFSPDNKDAGSPRQVPEKGNPGVVIPRPETTPPLSGPLEGEEIPFQELADPSRVSTEPTERGASKPVRDRLTIGLGAESEAPGATRRHSEQVTVRDPDTGKAVGSTPTAAKFVEPGRQVTETSSLLDEIPERSTRAEVAVNHNSSVQTRTDEIRIQTSQNRSELDALNPPAKSSFAGEGGGESDSGTHRSMTQAERSSDFGRRIHSRLAGEVINSDRVEGGFELARGIQNTAKEIPIVVSERSIDIEVPMASQARPTSKKVVDVVFDKIVRQAQLEKSGDSLRFNIRLKPEFLGRIQIATVLKDDGSLHANFRVEDPAVKAVFEARLPALLGQMQEVGFKVESFEIQGFSNRGSSEAEGAPDQNSEQGSGKHRKGTANNSSNSSDDSADQEPGEPGRQRYGFHYFA